MFAPAVKALVLVLGQEECPEPVVELRVVEDQVECLFWNLPNVRPRSWIANRSLRISDVCAVIEDSLHVAEPASYQIVDAHRTAGAIFGDPSLEAGREDRLQLDCLRLTVPLFVDFDDCALRLISAGVFARLRSSIDDALNFIEFVGISHRLNLALFLTERLEQSR
jgi:hypothetical protein